MKVSVETITPDLARKYLGGNTSNRPLRPGVVERYAEAISKGDWELNGETIKFSTDGILLDGQHRLEAIVKSGKSIQTHIVRDLPPEVYDTIDTGAARKPRDTLSVDGEANATILAVACRLLYMHEQLGSVNVQSKMVNLITTRDIVETLSRHPGMRQSVSAICGNKGLRPYISAQPAAFLHYVFRQIDQTQADLFFDYFGKGANLDAESPLLHLRNRLLTMKADNRAYRAEKIALIIKAWNLYRKKRPTRSLRWNETEDFPIAL